MDSSSDETIVYDPEQYNMGTNPKVLKTQGMYLFFYKNCFDAENPCGECKYEKGTFQPISHLTGDFCDKTFQLPTEMKAHWKSVHSGVRPSV